MAIIAHLSSFSRRHAKGVRRGFFCRESCYGQVMVESLIVLILLIAAFLVFFDFAYGAVARLFLMNASARVARADTVGFNTFQQMKAMRVGMIPVSGERLVPDGGRFSGGAYQELALIRTYLQAEDESEARGILNYERWAGLRHQATRDNQQCHTHLTFEIPSQLPYKLATIFGLVPTREVQTLRAHWFIEDHASYYLER